MTHRTLGLLDPSLNSKNTGDQIIAESVHMELSELLPNVEIVRLPTQTVLSRSERAAARSITRFVVGGTNILNGNIPRYLQWKLDPISYWHYRQKVSTMGVGWWQYQPPSNRVSRTIWRQVIGAGANSVRDTYTADRLARLGIPSTNTSCPTVWRLPSLHTVAEARPSSVVMTITDYNRNVERDLRLVRGLRDRYRRVLAWPQGSRDRDYLRGLDRSIEFLGPTVRDFDAALDDGLDYVGTRLHAGVRALQRGARSAIVAIDNRATEIASDIGLPVISKSLCGDDWERVDDRRPLTLNIPHAAIDRWKRGLVEWLEE
ncbi:polysaccharide pyruvyl transferase family protein [Sinomonas flava]|uniref:polysaccharide pyruvyl transferase family protein n=1 Tax=Sinomonas flava TaxID=496857 RepID=UPI0039A53767